MVLNVSIPSLNFMLQQFCKVSRISKITFSQFWTNFTIFFTIPITSQWNILMLTVSQYLQLGCQLPQVFKYFLYLYFQSLCLSGPLYICTIVSSYGGLLSSLKMAPFFCVFTANVQKSCLYSHLRKQMMKDILYETTQVNIPYLLTG